MCDVGFASGDVEGEGVAYCGQGEEATACDVRGAPVC